MDLCYITDVEDNVNILASIRTGHEIKEYEKHGINTYYPLYDGERITVSSNSMIELEDNTVILGSEYVVSTVLQMYKDYEIGQIEFDLFCSSLLSEEKNDLFGRVGIYFTCSRRDIGMKIKAMINESKIMFDEIVLQYPRSNIHEIIMSHSLLKDNYIGTVECDNISWFIFDKIKEPYLDMNVYDMLDTKLLWYNYSSLFTSSFNDQERFVFAYEIITCRTNPYLTAYDGFRVASPDRIDIVPYYDRMIRVMSEFSIETCTTLIDALRIRYKYKKFKTRIFKRDGFYFVLIHAYIRPELDQDGITDEDIRKDIISRLKVCKNEEDVVSLEKFQDMSLLELLHIIPHNEDGFTFCFSDEYNLDTNPYTRKILDRDNITVHYHDLFTRSIEDISNKV